MARILIVDDQNVSRRILNDILIEAGHQVVGEAQNGAEAVELFKKYKPEIITMDVVMPESLGIDALSAVKTIMELDSKAVIIMVSAIGQGKIIEDSFNAGAKDFVVKPFKREEVAGIIKKFSKK